MNPRRGATHKGQIAVGLMVLTGFVLVLVSFAVKLGQISQVRVETSNAADAGALAAGSWIVSGQNEAALMTQKMSDAVTMVQAIYLEPFCPGPVQRDYAEALWSSLVEHPNPDPQEAICGRAEPTGPYDLRGCGPVGYFREVANGVMEAAWNMGRREFLTAAVNNMMIRYPFTSDAEGNISNGNLWEKIRREQRRLQSDKSKDWSYFAWNNGRPIAEDSGFLHHSTLYAIDTYPEEPPQLQMITRRLRYYQYQPADEGEFFDCSFEGFGISYNADKKGPVADLQHWNFPSVSPLPDYPLAVDVSGRKNWDLNVSKMIPSIGHENSAMAVNAGVCADRVCGVDAPWTEWEPVRPWEIVRNLGDPDQGPYQGNLTTTVYHAVYTAKRFRSTDWDWWYDEGYDYSEEPVFETIEDYSPVISKATVHYEVAERSGFVINPTADACLIDLSKPPETWTCL